MINFGCSCGGTLIQKGSIWECDRCGSQYLQSADEKGNPFVFPQVEKKTIETGQMMAKATEVAVKQVQVKEIRMSDTIDSDIQKESLNIDISGNIRLAEQYMDSEDWESAQRKINQILLENVNCPEGKWLAKRCAKQAKSDLELLNKWTDFTAEDSKQIGEMLGYSSPKFARRIIDLFLEHCYGNSFDRDLTLSNVLEDILPYACNEAIYSPEQLEKKISYAFEQTIQYQMSISFDYLIEHMLQPHEVDRYIDYLARFAEEAEPALALEYYEKILEVDPSNEDYLLLRLDAAIDADEPLEVTQPALEALLRYTEDTDQLVTMIADSLCKDETTNSKKSDFFKALLGYHSEGAFALKGQIARYAARLLKCSLWEHAKTYFYLLISLNPNDAEAYLGLVMVRLQATCEEELYLKKEEITAIPEYEKAIDLFNKQGNTARAKALLSVNEKQKQHKAAVKLGIILAIIAAIVVAGYFIITHIMDSIKYDPDQVEISYNQTVSDIPYVYEVPLTLKNSADQAIREIKLELLFTDSEGNQLLESEYTVSWLNAESEGTTTLDLNARDLDILSAHSYAATGIEVTVTHLIFEDGEEVSANNTFTLKKAESAEETGTRLGETVDAFISDLRKVDLGSADYQTALANITTKLDAVWAEVCASEEQLQKLYDGAEALVEEQEYEKAVLIFGLLSSASYSDSTNRLSDITRLAEAQYKVHLGAEVREVYPGTVTLADGTEFILTRTAFEVEELLAGSDAESKLQLGDLLYMIDETPIQSYDWSFHFQTYAPNLKIGDTVTVYFYRNGAEQSAEIILTEQPTEYYY